MRWIPSSWLTGTTRQKPRSGSNTEAKLGDLHTTPTLLKKKWSTKLAWHVFHGSLLLQLETDLILLPILDAKLWAEDKCWEGDGCHGGHVSKNMAREFTAVNESWKHKYIERLGHSKSFASTSGIVQLLYIIYISYTHMYISTLVPPLPSKLVHQAKSGTLSSFPWGF